MIMLVSLGFWGDKVASGLVLLVEEKFGVVYEGLCEVYFKLWLYG